MPNQLKQKGGNVNTVLFREVSLVSGANPGAFIDSILRHGEVFQTKKGLFIQVIELAHAKKRKEEERKWQIIKKRKTVQDVVDSMRRMLCTWASLTDVKHSKMKMEEDEMKHNVAKIRS